MEMQSPSPVAIAISAGGGINLAINNWLRRGGDFSCRGSTASSEHDLAAMVSDFVEIGSAGAESWCSSDTDSGFSDLAYHAERISFYKHSVDQYESDLAVIVKSLILSMSEASQDEKPNACNSSCILYSLVQLLQSSGYDAALCTSKWQNFGKFPGGEHQFIDVIAHQDSGGSDQRYIIDIDFRSLFQIARAVKSYSVILSSLPAIFVGTTTKLKKILKIMVEAATYSLEQNSMPLPPWRSLPYLEAKWESPCQRTVTLHAGTSSISHRHCIGLLRRLKSFAGSDF